MKFHKPMRLLILAIAFGSLACTEEEESPQPLIGLFKGVVMLDSTELHSFDYSLWNNKNSGALVECTYGRTDNVLRLNFSANEGRGLRVGVQLPGSTGIGSFEILEKYKPVYIEPVTGRIHKATAGEFEINGLRKIKSGKEGKDDYISGSYWLTVPDSTSGTMLRVEVEFAHILVEEI